MGPDTTASPTWTRAQVRRTSTATIALLMAVWVIDYVDRTMVAIALPFIGEEFDLSKTEQGWLITTFALAYLVFQVPGGMLADRFGAKRLLLVSLLLWSVFTALTGAMWGFVALVVVRALFGVAQALFPGASFKALAERTTPDRRATGAGWMLASNSLGAGLAPLVVAPVLLAFGWRDTFWIVAGAGALIGMVLWALLPRPLPAELSEPGEPGDATPGGAGSTPGIGTVLRSSSVWKFAALFCSANMLVYGLITWVPSYLLEERGIPLLNAGIAAAIPSLVMTVTTFVGGWLFDRYFYYRARVLVIPVLLVAAAMLVLMLRAGSAVEFTIYQTLAMGVAGLSTMSVLGMPVRALPRAVIGSGMGVVNVGGQVAGVLAPVLMGALVDRFSYTAAFGFLIGTTVLSAVIAIWVPQRPERFELAEGKKTA
ncbi:MFS transporter [Pseudonocardia kunmingensis]|uniref:Sugar phosphate permease n=1 Tax=Pseudonocardia kunmingensis TaxID=630975 RepID=A0A543DRT1_9PSEU|nr:MFS transporter [Pseudonocardia kunmingensis]TQM12024.1 sugar phosphate permease [Pseudonocardia kunmingensis]